MTHDARLIHRILFLLLFPLVPFTLLFFPSEAHSKREHLVYFPNTAYELNVYKIYGKRPGGTLMLIGGIQGNEPGGFLSADLYADMSLEKGNLIVVPRCNFYSILLNHRGPHGDMNRKFAHEDTADGMEGRIVSILKKLIEESDYLLNLHDGSGYYYPEYINKWRNPMRYGQSVIADRDIYAVPGTDRVIKLGEMAKKVIEGVNPHIKNKLYRFHFNNTRTDEPDTVHKEQRKSATYYALTRHHIPAFGVETSKFLPSMDLKVRYHNLVINSFMKLFEIIPEHPRISLESPVLKYLVVSINGRIPTVVKDRECIYLKAGDTIHMSHIEANYERGLSVDILGYGDLNDFRKDFVINSDTSLIVRKDNQTLAEIPIRLSQSRGIEVRPLGTGRRIRHLVIQTRGQKLLLSAGETLDLVAGDLMKLIDVFPSFSGIKVNFKGFVSNPKNNTGEDRGHLIDTANDLMTRYSLKKKGQVYEIVVSRGKKVLGRFMVRLTPPRLDYLILRINGNSARVLRPGDTLSLSSEDEIRLEEIRSNIHLKKGLYVSIGGHRLNSGEDQKVGMLLEGFAGKQTHEILVKKDSVTLGRVFVRLENIVSRPGGSNSRSE